MRFTKASLAGIMLASAAVGFTTQAHADELPVKFSGGVTFLTDYRLRGASLSDTKPVIQGVVEATIPLNEFRRYVAEGAIRLQRQTGDAP